MTKVSCYVKCPLKGFSHIDLLKAKNGASTKNYGEPLFGAPLWTPCILLEIVWYFYVVRGTIQAPVIGRVPCIPCRTLQTHCS